MQPKSIHSTYPIANKIEEVGFMINLIARGLAQEYLGVKQLPLLLFLS